MNINELNLDRACVVASSEYVLMLMCWWVDIDGDVIIMNINEVIIMNINDDEY